MSSEIGMDLDRAVALIARSSDFRLLRRVRLGEGLVEISPETAVGVGAAVDVETTGLDVDKDRVIELAVRRFRYDKTGCIVRLDRPYSWTEDPGTPLSQEVMRITGLRDEDVCGTRIDDSQAVALISSAEVVVAHNARFDRGFVEKRLPALAGMVWACSASDVDWRALDFEGKALGWLLAQAGWFHGAHRAGEDVDALIELLRCRPGGGPTILSHLIDRAFSGGWLLRARGAAFECRGMLKARGYSWDPALKVWFREVVDAALGEERDWLRQNVYAPGLGARAEGPDIARIEPADRHRLH